MPSTSPPDDPDVFTAETLEAAMAAAVAQHGPDLVVHSARRVRAGVRGLMGKETYEVVATPAASASAAAAPAADPVEAALAALLDDAEAREQAQPTPRTPRGEATPRSAAAAAPRPTARAEPAGPTPAPTPAPAPAPAPAPRPKPAAARARPVREASPPPRAARAAPPPEPSAQPEPQPQARVQHPLFPVVSRPLRPQPVEQPRDEAVAADPLEVVEEPVPVPPTFPRERRASSEVLEGVVEDVVDEPVDRSAERRAPRKQARPPARRTTPHPDPAVADHTTSGARSWSRARLRKLGVPAKVLSLLPADDPRDDLGWLVALTGAIAGTVPAPAEPSAATPAVVHGYELAGALAILDACSRGAHPGTLTTGGRTVPATPTELALLVRQHVVADDA